MRVRITAFTPNMDSVSVETENYEITPESVDGISFHEALDYLKETVLDLYSEDVGIEDDPEEETTVGSDYLAAWVIEDPFDSEDETQEFLDRILEDTKTCLEDLE